ncbi:MAG: hypothetical protein PSV40_14250 [Polaromonas sp.]|uniref:hypothetical protein n=1 Tax=Polaromonas sp. TaxID=1869339 RepID=UPI00248855C7|nr:hypothetical protein [Polaromonas sp.]MDI1270243.1 hypothetical protein [Polaromonas sp.]
MLDSLSKSLGRIFEERFSSPLLSTFALSWVAWNYRFFVILFSDASVTRTFELIGSECYPNWWYRLGFGFFGPLLTTAIYFYALPKPSRWVYDRWKRTQQEHNETQYQYDAKSMLTNEESVALRAELRETVRTLDATLSEVDKLKIDLRAADEKMKTAVRESAEAVAGSGGLNAKMLDMERELQRLRKWESSSSLDPAKAWPFDTLTGEPRKDSPSDEIADQVAQALGEGSSRDRDPRDYFGPGPTEPRAPVLTQRQRALLQQIARKRSMPLNVVTTSGPGTQAANEASLDVLLERNFVELKELPTTGWTVYPTEEGADYLENLG